MKTLVVDYGRGNILSVCRAVERCGGSVELSDSPADVANAERLILPGVGAFGDCMAQLRSLGLAEPLIEFARSERPFLGICVGMQILFSSGEEFGDHDGLDLLAGAVKAIPKTASDGTAHKTPHIGWTPIELPEGESAACWDGTVLEDLDQGTSVYFVHSFTGHPEHAADRLADAHYGGRRLSAVVRRGALTGVQFHPEKSGAAGLKLVDAFLRI